MILQFFVKKFRKLVIFRFEYGIIFLQHVFAINHVS